jgi:hypothetical protein
MAYLRILLLEAQTEQVPNLQPCFCSKRRALYFAMKPNQRLIFGIHT